MVELEKFRKVNGIKQGELAEYLELTQGFVSQIEHGTRPLPDDKLKKILANANNWDVSMFSNKMEVANVDRDVHINPYLVRVLPIAARGGSLSDFSDSVREADCEKAISPIAGADFIIPVSGESMAPEYPNGSRIVVKKINDKAFVEWGKVYVLDTVNGAVIKEVRKGSNDDEVLCCSLNEDPKYAPFSINRKDILGMYRVLMCMSLK